MGMTASVFVGSDHWLESDFISPGWMLRLIEGDRCSWVMTSLDAPGPDLDTVMWVGAEPDRIYANLLGMLGALTADRSDVPDDIWCARVQLDESHTAQVDRLGKSFLEAEMKSLAVYVHEASSLRQYLPEIQGLNHSVQLMFPVWRRRPGQEPAVLQGGIEGDVRSWRLA